MNDSPDSPDSIDGVTPPPADLVEVSDEAAHGELNPRQRRLCHLLAAGASPAEVKKELGYSSSRISILQNNPLVRSEILRLQNRIFEETVLARLKGMSEAALNHLNFVLSDKTGRVKISEKNDIAKWLTEMLEGKATQKHDLGENMIGIFMDRLDARPAGQARLVSSGAESAESGSGTLEVSSRAVVPEAPKDELIEWVDDFCG